MFKVTLDYQDDHVHDVRIKYFDTVQVASGLAVLKTGFLFVASEFSNQCVPSATAGRRETKTGRGDGERTFSRQAHAKVGGSWREGCLETWGAGAHGSGLYQIVALGDDDPEQVESTASQFAAAGDLEARAYFQPRALKNLLLVDDVNSLCPIMDVKVCGVAHARGTSPPTASRGPVIAAPDRTRQCRRRDR